MHICRRNHPVVLFGSCTGDERVSYQCQQLYQWTSPLVLQVYSALLSITFLSAGSASTHMHAHATYNLNNACSKGKGQGLKC